MSSLARANLIAGHWQPAARGAQFARGAAGEADAGWPQSGAEDVSAASAAAESGARAWEALGARAREARLLVLAAALADDRALRGLVAARFGLREDEVAPHFAGLEHDVREVLARPQAAARGVAWLAHDWSELVRAPLVDLVRELAAGRVAVVVSDERLPELAERLCAAGADAELPQGVLNLLHGASRELVALALAGAGSAATLVASARIERTIELRRLCERHGIADPRLRALRCGAREIDPAADLSSSAAEVVEEAFGRGAELGGQLPGALGRVFCPARRFSRFSELLLEQLAASESARTPVPLIDAAAAERVRTAWELGLDEGATCIAGGEADGGSRTLPPTVFTNVELYMASAKRQDPLPVLCLLRTS
jgi:acyl-CoA reductase-like NAD-dependent aldehyde dehydrogenase